MDPIDNNSNFVIDPYSNNQEVDPFQSTETNFFTSENTTARFLSFNKIGKLVHTKSSLEDTISIQFNDIDFNSPIKRSFSQKVLKGDLTEKGFFLILKSSDTKTESVYYSSYRGNFSTGQKILNLEKNEQTIVISAMGDKLAFVTEKDSECYLRVVENSGKVYPKLVINKSFISISFYISERIEGNSHLFGPEKNDCFSVALLFPDKIVFYKINEKSSFFLEADKTLFIPEKSYFYFRFETDGNLYFCGEDYKLLCFSQSLKMGPVPCLNLNENTELEEFAYFPVYVKNSKIFFVRINKEKGDSPNPLDRISLKSEFLKMSNPENTPKDKNSINKNDKEAVLNGLLNSIVFNKISSEREMDKSILIVINNLSKKNNSECLILELAGMIKSEIGLNGALELCKNSNLFELSEKIQSLIGKRFLKDLNPEKEKIYNEEKLREKDEDIEEKIYGDEEKEDKKSKVEISMENEEKKGNKQFFNPFASI